MATRTVPITGLQYSYNGTNYYNIPIAPNKMELELEQVTANTYRTVGRKATLYTDFLCVIVKVSCAWSSMTREEYTVLSSIFYANTYIFLRFSNPDMRAGQPPFLEAEFKCGNLKFEYEFVDKNTGHPQVYSEVTQSYTQREAT